MWGMGKFVSVLPAQTAPRIHFYVQETDTERILRIEELMKLKTPVLRGCDRRRETKVVHSDNPKEGVRESCFTRIW